MNDIVPTIPDDSTLPQLYPARPDWNALAEKLQGLDGKALAREHLEYRKDDPDWADAVASEAREKIQELVALDANCKRFQDDFPEAWQNIVVEADFGPIKVSARVGSIIDWGKKLNQVRIDECNKASALSKCIKAVVGPYNVEVDHQTEEARLLAEAEAIAEAERERQATISLLEAQGSPEAKAEAEAIAAEPVFAPAISKQQASQVAGTANMKAAGVSSKTVYRYQIVDWAKFFAAQHANPSRFADLYAPQSDGSYRLSFASWKNKRQDIPGLKAIAETETTNRGSK